jgi:hypothetical protein
MGITLVSYHHDDNDAQNIWITFYTYMKNSTNAENSANELLAWLTTAKYDSTWRSSSQSYILFWLTRIKEYDTYCEIGESFSGMPRLRMLQCSVDGVQELRQVRINASHSKSEGRPTMTFQQFLPLLFSASAANDNYLKCKSQQKKQQVHSLDYEAYNSDIVSKPPFSVDTYLSPTKVKILNANHQHNFLPREDWLHIPEDIRAKLVANKSNGKVHEIQPVL